MFALLPLVALVASGSTIAAQVSAHQARPFNAEQLAEKLHIEESAIQSAFDEIKAEFKAERKEKSQEKVQQKQEKAATRFEEKLSKEVANGNITQNQKQLILDKRAELQAKWEAEQASLKIWSETNDIDMRYLFGFGGHKNFKGFTMFGHAK